MSNTVNDTLLEEALEYCNSGDLSSTPLEKLILNAIDRNDLEAVRKYVIEARNLLRDQ